MCWLFFLFVFLIAPLYHTQRWLADMVEDKGHGSFWLRVPYILLYLGGWVVGFVLGVALPSQSDSPALLRGLIVALSACALVAMLFFSIAAVLPDRRKSGTIYHTSAHGPDEDDLEEFRRARKRAAREMKRHKQRLREGKNAPPDDDDDDDLPVLRPRRGRD